MVTHRALVVEDDLELAHSLKKLLQHKGLRVDVVTSLNRAQELLGGQTYTLGIVDRVLPDGDGLELVELMSHSHHAMKVMMLSGQSSTQDRVAGLEQGASDYLAKPFSYKELELRVSNLLLSDKRVSQSTLTSQGIILLPSTGELYVEGVKTQLRPRETDILACLLRHRNQLLTRDKLISQVWGLRYDEPDYHTLDVYIRRIRAKLGPERHRLCTIRGFGFRLE